MRLYSSINTQGDLYVPVHWCWHWCAFPWQRYKDTQTHTRTHTYFWALVRGARKVHGRLQHMNLSMSLVALLNGTAKLLQGKLPALFMSNQQNK